MKESGVSRKKLANNMKRTSSLQTFDRIEWLQKRVLPEKLINRTIRLKYLVHPSGMDEHLAIKKVFNRFDEDGNTRLEAKEVKKKLDEHHLEVSESEITKLFKSAAINRPRNDPCKELSLYEFFVFSKSAKAAADFQKLIDKVKSKMLQGSLKRRVSALGDAFKEKNDARQILPLRREQYIKCLPSSFNPLMNHLKDEEKRQDLRAQIVDTLSNIDELLKTHKLQEALSQNSEALKELIGSHFPAQEADEEKRRLFSQKKTDDPLHVRMIQTLKRSLIANPSLSECSGRGCSMPRTQEEDTSQSAQGLGIDTKSAIDESKTSSAKVLRRFGNCASVKGLCCGLSKKSSNNNENAATDCGDTGKSNLLLLHSLKPKPVARYEQSNPRNKYYNRLLREKLVLKTNSMNSGITRPNSESTSCRDLAVSTAHTAATGAPLWLNKKVSTFEVHPHEVPSPHRRMMSAGARKGLIPDENARKILIK